MMIGQGVNISVMGQPTHGTMRSSDPSPDTIGHHVARLRDAQERLMAVVSRLNTVGAGLVGPWPVNAQTDSPQPPPDSFIWVMNDLAARYESIAAALEEGTTRIERAF